jgi:hypothetical protein
MAWRVAVAAVALGCGARREAPHPVAEDFVEVEYPPPPAQVEEMVEELPGRPECTWQDGHYEWSGRRYRWTPGEWVVAPPGCVYTEAVVSWVRGTPARLYYTPPRWYRAGPSGSARPVACPAATPCLSPPPPR